MSATGELSETVETTNSFLNKDLDPGLFLTVFLGYLDAGEHTISYVSGGQAPLLHYKLETKKRNVLDASATPLGILPFFDATAATPIRMDPGDVFFLASDGFYEWVDPDEEEFGTDRVFEVIENNPAASARDLIEMVLESVTKFARGAPQDDDLTAVVLKRHPTT